MFEMYDDRDFKYEITFSDNETKKLTENNLYEFYIFNDHNIDMSFEQILSELEKGFTLVGDDQYFDFALGTHLYKGRLTIKKCRPDNKIQNNSIEKLVTAECQHQNKYINHAGGIRFWVCPVCKKDLGNV